ncbi:MAG: putative protein involved in propionate catabolism [Rhodobacteraceae bacterium HLUCCA12]|nr:MAG: putative protein involved in propionate catabolism [Rhodobacteraceae bacterium HLUCCA12]
MNIQTHTKADLDGLTMRFAAIGAELDHDDLPEDVSHKAKLIIRDGIANQIAASATSEAAKAMVDLVREWGGAPQSTVSGSGLKLPAPIAAMCNGMMGHGVELDDAHGSGLIKAGSVLIPAVFAAAELNPKATGKDAVAAIVAAYELAIRVAKAINPGHRHRGYHTTSTVACIGAAVAAGRMLGCNTEQIASAIGLAAMQSSGIQAYLDDPCMAKPFGPGKAAFNGVLAAIMASRGFTGPRKVLESREGFLNAFTDEVRLSDLLEGLGHEFAIMEVGFKPHAACRYAHGPIDIAQHFRAQGTTLENTARVRVEMSKLAIRQASKYPCPSMNAAMGSTQFGIALALAKGSNGLRDYWDGYGDPVIHDGAGKVTLEENPEFGIGGRQSVVHIETTDGRKLSHRQEEPKGEPTHPMSNDELEKKFASTAGLVIDQHRTVEISRRIMSLETEPSAAAFPQLTVAVSDGGTPQLRAG